MKTIRNLFLLGMFLCLVSVTDTAAQSFKVIVNEANPTTEISKDELSAIFLKTKTSWSDGVDVFPIDQSANSTVRAAFSVQVHGKSVGEIRTHWQQAAFSGGATAPLERSNDAAVLNFIQNNPGAVGYISAATEATGVKVITVN